MLLRKIGYVDANLDVKKYKKKLRLIIFFSIYPDDNFLK